MNLWRTIASLASRRTVAPDCADCPDGLPGDDPGFSAAVTALGAKLAKADGAADHLEFVAFSEAFQPQANAERDVGRLYHLARQTTHGYESYARRIGRRYSNCPGVLEDVMGGLFHIAKADGAVTTAEMSYLENVSSLLGMSPLTFRRIRTEHLGAQPGDPYHVLGVKPDAPDEQVRAAWKAALRQAHPDLAAGRGLSLEERQSAERRSAALNAAFDEVMRERHDLIAATAD